MMYMLVLLLDFVLICTTLSWDFDISPKAFSTCLMKSTVTYVCCDIVLEDKNYICLELSWNQIIHAACSSWLTSAHFGAQLLGSTAYIVQTLAISIRKISLKSMLSNLYMMPTMRIKWKHNTKQRGLVSEMLFFVPGSDLLYFQHI
jgi:hypothetical protein